MRSMLDNVIDLVKERCVLMPDFFEQASFFFQRPSTIDREAISNKWNDEKKNFFLHFSQWLETTDTWEPESLESAFKQQAADQKIKPGELLLPLRIMLVGGKFGPPVFQISALIGSRETVERIQAGLGNSLIQFTSDEGTKPHWPIIIALAIIKFILPFILQSSVWELQRDEFLYYQQGLHPALGYLENPPLLSWLGMVSSWLGGSEFWIKWWPSLFGSLTLIITCLITAEFGGKRFAQFLSGMGIILAAYMRVHALFQPNILDIFFWTLAIYFIVRYINTNAEKYLFLVAISLALGFWSKYSVIFIAASLILSLLLTYHRQLFTKKKYLPGGRPGHPDHPSEYFMAIQPPLAADPSYARIAGNAIAIFKSC